VLALRRLKFIQAQAQAAGERAQIVQQAASKRTSSPCTYLLDRNRYRPLAECHLASASSRALTRHSQTGEEFRRSKATSAGGSSFVTLVRQTLSLRSGWERMSGGSTSRSCAARMAHRGPSIAVSAARPAEKDPRLR